MKFLVIDDDGAATQFNWNQVPEDVLAKVENEYYIGLFKWENGNFFQAEVTVEEVEEDEENDEGEVETMTEYDLTWNLVL